MIKPGIERRHHSFLTSRTPKKLEPRGTLWPHQRPWLVTDYACQYTSRTRYGNEEPQCVLCVTSDLLWNMAIEPTTGIASLWLSARRLNAQVVLDEHSFFAALYP